MAAASTFSELLSLRDRGEFEQAIEQADLLLRRSPDDVDVLLVRGQVKSFLGQFGDAEADLENALGLAPDYHDVALTLARVRGYQAKNQLAIKTVENVLAKAPKRLDGWLLLADLTKRTGDQSRRYEALTQASFIDNLDPDYLSAMGDWHAENNNADQAIALYQQRLETHGFDQGTVDRINGLESRQQRWLVTTAGSISDFDDNDRNEWREWFTDARYEYSDLWAYRVRFDYSQRFGRDDLQIGAGVDRQINERTLVTGTVALTPDADFRPKAQITTDLRWFAYQSAEREFSTSLSAGIQLSQYTLGTARSFRFGVTQYFPDFWVSATLTNSLDEQDNHDFAWVVRGDLPTTENTRLFAGGGYETDRTLNGSVLTRVVFAGANIKIQDQTNWFIDGALETPEQGAERRSITTGISLVF